MIVTADWLVTTTGRPIRSGAVLTRGNHITAVGPLEELKSAAPSEPVEHFEGCVLIPGLVDAHTRLSLTVLKGLIPATGTSAYLRQVDKAVLALSNDDLAASATLGALECLRCGITSVGDVGYGPEPLASCADLGVGGVFYWEVRGIDADALSGELAEMEFPAEVGACTTGRIRCGISPHTGFTSDPSLIKAEWQVSQRHRVGFAIHVAESHAEHDLMWRGEGPLTGVARTFARGFASPRKGTVSYLEELGVLSGAVAVGCVYLDRGDAARLKRATRGVVLCPRSSARLGNDAPPVSDLSAAGVRLALGTGSGATEPDLFAEARALSELDSALTPRALLAMITRAAAETLGTDDTTGSLAPNMQADLALVETGPTEDPEGAVLRLGGSQTVRAVLSGGVWRVREGKIALPTAAAERAADRARETVRRALEN